MNPYIKFGEILSICSQDIEWKWNYDWLNGRRTELHTDGWTEGMTDNQNPI